MLPHLTALVTVLAVLLLFGTAALVGRARGKYGVQAPATTGHPVFERFFRIQMNTLENTVVFLPSLWLFSYYASAKWAAVIGFVWLGSRLWYAVGYAREAKARAPGFLVCAMCNGVLALGALGGIVSKIMA